MSKRGERWLEPRAYRRLQREEYRRERLLRQFYLRLVAIVCLFAAVATMFALHTHLWGRP
ncbi:hypothetical protein [Tautonia sociabilis]|uniref:Uncharacterized protein n=1 Tax=Tautonia sociabilis TaxID=2080755 RepID=A0A432MF42_9BACT|nr:hypothetical protein [Tautonia sociabilis]RUL84387.1 hypothetical protein TsocGM_20455 [Tautonia sociabilis]